MEEIDGLDYLSPNERQRYIQEQLQQSRVERIKASRKQFSDFCKSRLDNYSKKKKDHEEKKKKKTKERTPSQIEQIEYLTSRIATHRKNLGSAQNRAIDEMIQKQNYDAKRMIEKAEQEKKANERYQNAIERVRANDPRIPFQERANTINNAKAKAKKHETDEVAKYNEMVKQQKMQEKERIAAQKAQENIILNPRLSISDFANTHFHAGIGLIPTNFEGVNYAKEIEKAEENEKALKKQRKIDAIKRAQKAAFHHQVQKDSQRLAKELQEIHQEEVDEQLTAIKKQPQNELISAATYNLEARDQRKQARIQRFLAFNDEAPEPRGEAPQPYPQFERPITTSPVQSSDSEDDINNRFNFE